jgi:hypothetical protein
VAQEPARQVGRPYPPPAAAEPFWPAQLTILAAIGLQVALPKRLVAGPVWLVPAAEGVLFIGMFLATPRQLEHEHKRRRRAALGLTALVGAANVYSLISLTNLLLSRNVGDGRQLIVSGVLIWMTNFLIFALWYWEMDRGGAGKRAAGHDGPPDFLFPQMSDDRIEPLADQCDRVLAHRHDAADVDREVHDGHPVAGVAGDDRPGCLPRREHPRVADGHPLIHPRVAGSHPLSRLSC